MGFSFCLAVFISLLIGALLGVFISKWLKSSVHYISSLCAGALGGVLFLELIPHSFGEYDYITVLLGILIGFLLIYSFDFSVHCFLDKKIKDSKLAFYFLLLAITIHNVPSGLALGNHADSSGHLSHIIILHHIPEGMSLMLIAYSAFIKTRQVIIISFAFLSVSLFGVVSFGLQFPITNNHLVEVLLGFSISTFGYVIFIELLLPALKVGSKSLHFLSALFGIFIIQVVLFIG
ncbi:ZIP family zinc transporter [Metabacillus crassostreae]|uniref:ZIP family metal transporter n=1 Tax=Metabacillus crassostreae TaxID=929098 RepID=UPI001956821F|nr:hypothetical protein [Metabacillus crassostreae]MBM7602225.1 ZIP family zinc transporter [Metabacillus crassostreae]